MIPREQFSIGTILIDPMPIIDVQNLSSGLAKNWYYCGMTPEPFSFGENSSAEMAKRV